MASEAVQAGCGGVLLHLFVISSAGRPDPAVARPDLMSYDGSGGGAWMGSAGPWIGSSGLSMDLNFFLFFI
jgi:hypothetical protein